MQDFYKTNSLIETQKIAQELASQFINQGGIILLSGNLGAGKTAFTQGFIKSYGINQKITSPTFLLVKQYQIPNSTSWIFHLDLYRLVEPIDLITSGIQEILDTADKNIILIEWSEKIKSQLSDYTYIEVHLQKEQTSDDSRTISIEKHQL